MKLFITGTAGFIGFHLARRLLEDGHTVTGFDGLTAFYDVSLKTRRHEILEHYDLFTSVIGMLEDMEALSRALAASEADVIVHLAAQAGVRYSIDHPQTYISSNLIGTANLLEAARANKPAHLLFASTSSVYGGNLKLPFAEIDRADGPVSLYAATKKGGEAMTHSYAHLFQIPTTCFRFFTVYGPWGRPDMALFKFVSAIDNGLPIDVFGDGKMRRDFTYIDDLVEAIVRLIDLPPEIGKPVSDRDSLSPVAPWRTVNIAGGAPIGLMEFIDAIEQSTGVTAQKIMLPMQMGDVVDTFADSTLLSSLTGFLPATGVTEGVDRFVKWYRSDYANHHVS